jgi:pyruvate formate-lyase/glycerol dehydratase family glycyl radical enzyme
LRFHVKSTWKSKGEIPVIDYLEQMEAASAGFPQAEWTTTRPTARVAAIKQRLLDEPRYLDVERARYTTEAYRATEGQPMARRRAQMLLHLVRQQSITIQPGELIVGNRSLLPRMGIIAPEGAVAWIDKELDILPTRPQDRFNTTPEVIRALRAEIFPYWRGYTLEDTVAQRVPDDVRVAVKGRAFSLNQTDHAQGHILPDVEAWLRLGIGGLREQVLAARDCWKKNSDAATQRRGDVQREDKAEFEQETSALFPRLRVAALKIAADREIFYDAALIALQAAQEFMLRYANLAAELARDSCDPERARELERIAANCHWLSAHPARDFHEALQAVWFLFALLQIESNASSFSPGRFDQYMLPYLEADLAAGKLTLATAQELLECLWLKFNEIVLLRSSHSARYFAGFPIGFNVALGGRLADSRDATNLLSFMCLRAQVNLGMTQPNLSIRIHEQSPDDFLRAASCVIGKGSGMPQVFNDEVIIPGQIARGVTPEDARNYAIVGCVELSTPGKALGWSDASMFNLTRVLELTIFGGRDPQTGAQIGLVTPTLAEMGSIAELEAAYDSQLAHFVPLMVKGCNVVDQIHAELLPSPFLSLVIQDCIARGLDVTAGGAHYNFSGVQGVQIANVADSLAAVEQAVFQEKWLSGQELLDALRTNYEGAEVLRQRLIHRVPKYGNDDARVDLYASKWGDRYAELVEQHRTIRGGVYQPGFYTVSAHVPMGAAVGATPDGRHTGTPLADGGLSPTAGRDRRGATAVLQSVSRLDLKLASNGTLLNMKFLPSFFAGDHALDKFVLLLRGFCRLHIPHVQFNVVSAATLRAAQTNPEAYRSLVVRVAGYSAYFTELDKDLQNEIIARTEFGDAN